MAFYGIQPSELAKLSDDDKWMLLVQSRRINAKRRMQKIWDECAVEAAKENRREYLMDLIRQAYPYKEDELARANHLEAITRKG
jgi:hypothetical protein